MKQLCLCGKDALGMPGAAACEDQGPSLGDPGIDFDRTQPAAYEPPVEDQAPVALLRFRLCEVKVHAGVAQT